MSKRYGNDYLTLIQADQSFNAEPTDLTSGWTIIPDKMVVGDEAPEEINTDAKDNHIVRYNHTSLAGLKKPKVTLSGELTWQHDILWEALTGDAGPYSIQNQNTVNSYTIVKVKENGASDIAIEKVTGCVLETLRISGGFGEPITYEAVFRAGTVNREVSESYGTIALPTNDIYLWQFMDKPSLGDGNIETMNNFELSFTRVFADDKFMFPLSDSVNNNVWSNAFQCEITGELSVDFTYDDTNDSNIYDSLMVQTMKADTITLKDAASNPNSSEIATYGQYTSYDLPDPDRCIFEGNFTKKLLYDGSNEPLTVTHTAKS